MPSSQSNVRAKICLFGEAAVGKTSLVRRFVLDQFGERYSTTLGAKVMKKDVVVAGQGPELRITLVLWDIMGEPSFRDLLREAYFSGAQGLLAVADLSRPDTIPALRAWIDAARGVAGSVPLLVLGNKADLRPGNGAPDALAAVARAYGTDIAHTSAKTGENVERAFATLAGAIVGGGAGGRAPQP